MCKFQSIISFWYFKQAQCMLVLVERKLKQPAKVLTSLVKEVTFSIPLVCLLSVCLLVTLLKNFVMNGICLCRASMAQVTGSSDRQNLPIIIIEECESLHASIKRYLPFLILMPRRCLCGWGRWVIFYICL